MRSQHSLCPSFAHHDLYRTNAGRRRNLATHSSVPLRPGPSPTMLRRPVAVAPEYRP